MLMKTMTKLALAKFIYFIVFFIRSALGKGMIVTCKRKGIVWHLDLGEVVDLTIYVLGYFEPDVTYFYLNKIKPGETVLDIGANVGPHTLVFSKLVGSQGHVYAIEPTQFAYDRMLKNINLNPQLSAAIHPFLMGFTAEKNDILQTEISSSFRIDTALDDDQRNKLDCGYAHSTSKAKFMTLDDFVNEQNIKNIDWIKLDVDGNEIKVLRGAKNVLKNFSPKILIELSPIHFVDPSEPFEEMIVILQTFGYTLKNINGKKLISDPLKLKESIPHGVLITAIAEKI